MADSQFRTKYGVIHADPERFLKMPGTRIIHNIDGSGRVSRMTYRIYSDAGSGYQYNPILMKVYSYTSTNETPDTITTTTY
jgi:hypothetical protein